MKYQFVYLNVVKYLFTYLKLRIFKCSYRIYIYIHIHYIYTYTYIYIHTYIYIYISTISMAAPQNIGLGSGFSHGHHGRHGRHGHHGQDQMLQMLKSPSMEVLSIQSRRGSGACCCGALRG